MELSPQAAAAEWSKGTFRPAYLLYGEDDAAKLSALGALSAALAADPMNACDLQGDSDAAAGEALGALNTAPMFSDKRLVVLRNLRLGAAARKELAGYLRKPMAGATLVLVSPERKLEAKDPLAAAVAALGGVVAFKALREAEAIQRLREEARKSGFELSAEAADKIVEEAGAEWGVLKAELEKLRLFVRGKKSAGLADALACLGFTKDANPFDFPRSLQARDLKKSLGLLKRMQREGADEFPILYEVTRTLNKQLKAKRLLKGGAAPESIFRELRLNAYYDRDYLAQAGRISEERLRRDLRACLETEVALKSKSWLDPFAELALLVGRICAPSAPKPAAR